MSIVSLLGFDALHYLDGPSASDALNAAVCAYYEAFEYIALSDGSGLFSATKFVEDSVCVFE